MIQFIQTKKFTRYKLVDGLHPESFGNVKFRMMIMENKRWEGEYEQETSTEESSLRLVLGCLIFYDIFKMLIVFLSFLNYVQSC
jgi:hypothetical protein